MQVSRRRRGVLAAAMVALLVVVGALAWVALHFSNQALGIERAVTTEAVAVPDGEGRVRLTGDRLVALPGRYGLAWEGGYADLGDVVGEVDSGDPVTATRRSTPAVGVLAGAVAARVDQNTFTGDPRSARGLAFSDVVVDGELGDLPAWYVPAASLDSVADGDRGRTWVVFVHGRGADRREALRYLPTWHQAGLPVLVATYRNDLGVAPAADRRNHLGEQEWRDIDAAVRYALDAGARDVVLAGVSMGAAVALQVADRSEQRAKLRGLVLDSPVMDWRDVFVYQGGESGLPGPISRLAIWTVERRIGIDLDRYDWVARSADLRLPILLFAPDGDTYVPSGPAQAVAGARPDLVELVNVEAADHTRSWNVDPARYERVSADWLADIGAAQPVALLQTG